MRAQRDLSLGLADSRLLPALAPALRKAARMPRPASGRPGANDSGLLWLARSWFADDGVPAAALAVTGGALDAVERVLAAHLLVGDRVVVEDPGYPPIVDLLRALGLAAVPVAVDERGLIPAALAEALARDPAALVYVPRGQNPTGAALDRERAVALRAVLSARPELLLVEDDHVSLVSGAPYHSAIAPGRSRWIVIRSLSKLLHPDLRIALVAGDETTIARLEGRQTLGTRWVSHILQETAAAMLADPGFVACCTTAANAYAERRHALISELASLGVSCTGASGLNVWASVNNEAPVVRALDEAGFLVLAGERFRFRSPPAVRVTAAALRDGEAVTVAAAIAQSLERPGAPLGSY